MPLYVLIRLVEFILRCRRLCDLRMTEKVGDERAVVVIICIGVVECNSGKHAKKGELKVLPDIGR